jgi:hypothetical protein
MDDNKQIKKTKRKQFIYLVLLLSISALAIFILLRTQGQPNLDLSLNGVKSKFTDINALLPAQTFEPNISVETSTGKWVNTRATGSETNLTFWKLSDDKKTELGWIPKSGSCIGQVDKLIYGSNGLPIKDDKNKNILVKCETAKCGGANCYHISLTEAQAVNVNDYIKLGTNSNVVQYLNGTLVKLVLGNKDINAKIYKNVVGVYNEYPNVLFGYYNLEKYKFGANDTSENLSSWNQYKYDIFSEFDVSLIEGNYYFEDVGIRVLVDFEDICNKNRLVIVNNTYNYTQTAGCVISNYSDFEYYNIPDLEGNIIQVSKKINHIAVTFWSNSEIDPSYIYNNYPESNMLLNRTVFEGNNMTHLEINNSISPYNQTIAYYSFDVDNTVTAYDITGNNKDATYSGVFSNNSGVGNIYDGFAQFDGINDFISLGNNAVPVTDKGAIVGWFKPTISSALNTYMMTDMASNTRYVHIHFAGTNPRINFREGGTEHYVYANGNITIGEWNHVVWQSTGTAYEFYINGVLQNKTISFGLDSGNWFSDLAASTKANFIGKFDRLGGASNYFNGSMDEFMIFNRSLSAAEVLAIYNNQSVRFKPRGTQTYLNIYNNTNSSHNRINLSLTNYEFNYNTNVSARIGYWNITKGYNQTRTSGTLGQDLIAHWTADNTADDLYGVFNGTVLGDANYGNIGIYNNRFAFDGVNDGINVSSVFNSRLAFNKGQSGFAWINTGDNAGGKTIFGNTDWDSPYMGLDLRVDASGNFTIDIVRTGSNLIRKTYVTNLENAGWHFVGFTYTGSLAASGVKLFYDGVEVSTTTLYDSLGGVSNISVTDFQIGSRDGLNADFNGSIDDVMIWNRTLTASEVKELYIKGRANWEYTDYSNLTGSLVNNTISVPLGNTNYLPELMMISDNNSFYTPYINGSLRLDTFYRSDAGDSMPAVDIVYPIIGVYNVSAFDLNYTASDLDVNLDKCWYSFDGGITNSTTQLCGTNWTGLSASQGSNTWTVYANDTTGLLGSDSVTFTVDTIAPQWSNIKEPTDPTTYNPSNFYEFNITWTDATFGLETVLIEFNQVNYTMTNISNNFTKIFAGLSAGTYNYYFFANDTVNNINTTQVYTFTIDKAVGDIEVYLNNQTNNITVEVGSLVTYNVSRLAGESNINVTKDGIQVNYGTATTNNTTPLTIGYINITGRLDASQNYTGETQSRYIQVVDTTFPQVNIIYPLNTSYNQVQTMLNYTRSDASLNSCWYSLNGGVTNVSIPSCGNVTGLTSSQGSNAWTVWVNDSVNNINFSLVRFSVDSIDPIVTYTAPLNTSVQSSGLNNIEATGSETGYWWYMYDGPTSLAWTQYSGNPTDTFSQSVAFVDGFYNITVRLNDTLNNSDTHIEYNIEFGTVAPSNVTSVSVSTCRYKKLGYFNIKLPWIKQANCI